MLTKENWIVTNVMDAEKMVERLYKKGWDLDTEWTTGIYGEPVLKIKGQRYEEV